MPWSALATPIPDNGPITNKLTPTARSRAAPRSQCGDRRSSPHAQRRLWLLGLSIPALRLRRLAPYGYGYGRGAGWWRALRSRRPPDPLPARRSATSRKTPNSRARRSSSSAATGGNRAGGVFSALKSSTTSSASGLKSADVYAANGDLIGHLDQVMIDPQHGETAFVLVERGGFSG